MKKHRKLDIIAIVLTIILLMTICVNVCVYIYKIISPLVQNKRVQKEYEELIKQRDEQLANIRKTKTEEEKNKEELEEVKEMEEKKRITYYFSKYITYLEEKNYEKAYDLLYEEYKNNYFPTLEDFEKYAKERYPDFMRIEHTYMSRQGDYYILTVNIYNLLTNEIIEKEQKYVIKEKDFLDYVLSFQVR